MTRPWIGCDLDGTIAHYGSGHLPGQIGAPIAPMVDRMRGYLAQGYEVRIVTARVTHDPEGVEQRAIGDWTERHVGVRLKATASKDYSMVRLYDDRAVQVVPNTGMTLEEACAAGAKRRSEIAARLYGSDRKYPLFCGNCGYAAPERVQHHEPAGEAS